MWTVSVVLLDFVTFCSDSFGFALVLFHSAWVEHCSGTVELGFSLSALSRGLSSLCDHLTVQYFIVIYLGGEFPQGFSPCVGALGSWSTGDPCPGSVPITSCKSFTSQCASAFSSPGICINSPLKSQKSCPAVAVYNPWSVSLGAAAEGSRVKRGVKTPSAAQQPPRQN